MPGVAGIISKRRQELNGNDLECMIAGMMHEKFYISGTYANSRLGVHVGWACHKGTFADCMPVFNDRKDVVLIFAGENFADDDVVRRMGRKSLAADQTNAGYLAHLYEED